MTQSASSATDNQLPRILAIGNSHLTALKKAYEGEPKAHPALDIQFLPLNGKEYRPPLKDGQLNPAIARVIREARPEIVISAIGGNAHNVLGLINHPVRFDFVLPAQPDLPLDENSQIVPFAIVSAWLEERLQMAMFPVMAAVQQQCACPLLHLEPPPPIPDTNYILRNTEVMLMGPVEELGIAPAVLRYKLWRLHSALIEQFCRASGIIFVPVPREMQDASGMLIENAWGHVTHGNALFGTAVLNAALIQMRAIGVGAEATA